MIKPKHVYLRCPFCFSENGRNWNTIMTPMGDENDSNNIRWIKALCTKCMEYRYVNPYNINEVKKELD